jgi:uncharacterized protein YgbK (DUF1537 family)
MTYNFDPERWQANERAHLARELKAGRLTPAGFAAAVEDLDRRSEEMWRRLDGAYQLPGGASAAVPSGGGSRPGFPAEPDLMLELAVVADDITGAADSGIPFAAACAPVCLTDHRRLGERGPLAEDAPRVLSVFTSTRDLDPGSAGRALMEVGRALAALRPGRVYKKIDSCLRGNIGCELEALMASLGRELSFIAPAFPAQGRTTCDGVHRLHGVPVAETEVGRDPLAPVMDSRPAAWIGRQTRHACAHVGIGLLDAGEQALAAEIDRRVASGARHLTFDAVDDAHLDQIAALALRRYPGALLCGSAGLARSLAREMTGHRTRTEPWAPPRVPSTAGHFLFVCGSASETLHRQVEALARAAPVAFEELSCETLLASERAGAVEAAQRRTVAALGRGPVVVRIAPPGKTAARVDARALAAALGRFAGAVIAARRPGGVFLSGGDTAAAVFDAVKTRVVRLEGELSNGVVWGTVRGGTMDGLPVATKAGAFGRPDALLRFHGELRSIDGAQ